MNDALLVYKPRKRVRKKPSNEKLQPLVAKRVAQKWQRDATECFVETDLFLRWRATTNDDRLDALQAMWAAVYGHSSDKYRVCQPSDPLAAVESLPRWPLAKHSTESFEITDSNNPSEHNVHEAALPCAIHAQATENGVPALTSRLRLKKAMPIELSPQIVVSQLRAAAMTDPLSQPDDVPPMEFTQRGGYSMEMRRKLEEHVRQKMAGNVWQDEVRSMLARPLDATVFVNRVEQLDHTATSQSYAGFACHVPRDATGGAQWRYPYSNHAHGCARMIYRCYKTSCDRHRMKTKLRSLVVATRLLQDFFRFRVHRLVHRRRVRAVHSIVARRLQRPMRSYLSGKQSSARQIQSRWRQVQAKKELVHRRRLHRAATIISRAGIQFMSSQRRRNDQAICIQRTSRAWLWRRFRRQAETSRRELEMAAMREASKAATAACMVHLMTAEGKAELKRERKRMAEVSKLAKKQYQAAPSSGPSSKTKEDLETMAIRHSFDAFDTDGSGSIDLDELRLLLSELGIPISEQEVLAGFQEMDTDGSGTIDFDEFAAWWRKGLTAGKAKTQMALLRLKLRGQSLIKRITGAEARAQAAKQIANRRRLQAMMAAREAFRRTQPPVIHCHMCQMPFGLERDWFRHTRHHCSGRDELQQSSAQ